MGKNKALNFKTYEEAADWFDNQDMADLKDQLKPVDFSFDLRKNRNWVELDTEIAKRLRLLAREKHISTHTLVNELLKEKMGNLK